MSIAPRAAFDTPPDRRVADRAARQHGRVRLDQLLACGLDRAAVARRVQKGHLHRVHNGVYAVGHAAETVHSVIMGAVLAGGDGAVASHWASATLWGFVRWDDRAVDVTAPGTGGRKRQGIRFHRSRSLTPRDITRRHGIPTTTAARALLEIAPQLSDHRLKRLTRQAQAENATNVRQLADTIARANGHRATARLAALIATGPAPTRSSHEDIVLDLILKAGFQRPDVNKPLSKDHIPDLRWPTQRLILEVDSPWHDGHLAQELDATRQAALEAQGERVLRTTKQQAQDHPHQLVQRLRAAGAPYTETQR
ncbi:MAG TPA: type IV toxin-antitoxin system AbiEi family antitoxin domain-containing protein [Solirubrobacteraceae bacterium]|nr:type IV toxin-antitoxin system AbiEi family antitoxin domain-containing protein [Solirubrobacteraceae bacterium]